MRLANTVFWSWQSDLDGPVTRALVRYALDEALVLVAADLEEADRPSLTSETQGVAGTPDIVATILRKIDGAAVIAGDVTPIARSEPGKGCAHPNVLLEMGYANNAIGERRVIQVWNTAFDGACVDMLPFDMRGDVTPCFPPAAIRVRRLFEGPPVSCPGIVSVSGLHLPGLTPADAANSAGVSQPKEV